MQDKSFVQVKTDVLREKLNKFYGGANKQPRHFQDLWDLKEMAMMEQRKDLMVPSTWLDEVDQSSVRFQ